MKKKIVAGAVTLLSVAVLAACGKTSGSDKDIITMKGDTITVSEFYDKVKSNPSAQQVLLNLTIKEVFEKQYGKKVTDKEVEEAYEKSSKAYGDNFARVLAQAGLTGITLNRVIPPSIKFVAFIVETIRISCSPCQ